MGCGGPNANGRASADSKEADVRVGGVGRVGGSSIVGVTGGIVQRSVVGFSLGLHDLNSYIGFWYVQKLPPT